MNTAVKNDFLSTQNKLPKLVHDFHNRVVLIDGVYSAQHSVCILPGVKISDDTHNLCLVIESSLPGTLSIIYVSASQQEIPANVTIRAKKFSKAQIVEFYVSTDGCEFPMHSRTSMIVEESAEIRHFSFSLGENSARHDIDLVLDAPQAWGSLDGLYLARNKQSVKYHTIIRHQTPHTTSRQLYKGILSDEARVLFDGKIVVNEGAVFTDSMQLNKNLLLSKKAHVDTQPQLEIANNDVKCTHGATVGQMDAEEIFYFESRGIPKKTAIEMLIHGFVDDVLSRIRDDDTKERFGKLLEERFFS